MPRRGSGTGTDATPAGATGRRSYVINPYFLWKMVMLALAGLNMMYFHFFTYRTVEHWDLDPSVPTGAKIAGALSLIFWLAVVFFGRAIGFTLGIFY